jgi:hypothetical protein
LKAKARPYADVKMEESVISIPKEEKKEPIK